MITSVQTTGGYGQYNKAKIGKTKTTTTTKKKAKSESDKDLQDTYTEKYKY